MSDQRQQLTACGFEIGSVPFTGTAGTDVYFASKRSETESHVNHFYTIDFAAGTAVRSGFRGAEFRRFTIAELLEHFSPVGEMRVAPFIDRLKLLGFRLQASTDRVSEKYQLQNFYGSIGDGSRWMICSKSEKVIRFDVRPWRIFRLDGAKLVECSNADEKLQPVEQIAQRPAKPTELSRQKVGVSRPDVGYSGASQQRWMFE